MNFLAHESVMRTYPPPRLLKGKWGKLRGRKEEEEETYGVKWAAAAVWEKRENVLPDRRGGKEGAPKIMPRSEFFSFGDARAEGKREGGRRERKLDRKCVQRGPLSLPPSPPPPFKILPRQKGTQSGAPSLPSGGEKRRLMLKFYFGVWFLDVFCSLF